MHLNELEYYRSQFISVLKNPVIWAKSSAGVDALRHTKVQSQRSRLPTFLHLSSTLLIYMWSFHQTTNNSSWFYSFSFTSPPICILVKNIVFTTQNWKPYLYDHSFTFQNASVLFFPSSNLPHHLSIVTIPSHFQFHWAHYREYHFDHFRCYAFL